jgi:hypothetical protein
MKKLTELEIGMDTEQDHTLDKHEMCSQDTDLARVIAQHHLKDDSKYYSKLKASGLDDTPSVAIIQVSAEPVGQTSLNSSGLGKGGIATPLKTSNIKAPAEKAKIGANKIVVGKTPTMSGNIDPLNYFASQIMGKC